jgi:putative ABC transport system ATP-binding protein
VGLTKAYFYIKLTGGNWLNMALIELQEVSKVYGFGDATVLALDEVFLSVEKGEFVAIMGPSGSGKTTLLNLTGLLDRPTHGVYMLDGRHVARVRPNRQARVRRDRIGFVFQSHNLLPRINVLENVALPLAYRGMTPVRRLKTASDMLERSTASTTTHASYPAARPSGWLSPGP